MYTVQCTHFMINWNFNFEVIFLTKIFPFRLHCSSSIASIQIFYCAICNQKLVKTPWNQKVYGIIMNVYNAYNGFFLSTWKMVCEGWKKEWSMCRIRSFNRKFWLKTYIPKWNSTNRMPFICDNWMLFSFFYSLSFHHAAYGVCAFDSHSVFNL